MSKTVKFDNNHSNIFTIKIILKGFAYSNWILNYIYLSLFLFKIHKLALIMVQY